MYPYCFHQTNRFDHFSKLKKCPSVGIVKGFQIACNLTGPLGDLTGKGDQPSRKMVYKKGTRQRLDTTRAHQAPTGPNREGTQGVLLSQSTNHWDVGLDELTSQKVVLERGAGQAKQTTSTESEQPEGDTQKCSGWSIGYR